jgi:hypothetical protein
MVRATSPRVRFAAGGTTGIPPARAAIRDDTAYREEDIMTLRLSAVRSWPRRVVTAFTAVVAAVILTATQASAVTTGHYSFAASGGASFQFLTSGNLVSGTADDVIFHLSTTASGIHRLPFALHLYNQTYTNLAVSTNGNVQPGTTTGNSTFSNDCLPTSQFGRPLVAPFWDDLFFDSNDTSHGFMEGVFVRTSGTAPHRKFLISWQGHFFSASSSLVLAQVLFTEGSQNVQFVYGLNGSTTNPQSGGSSATIGIQSKQQLSFTQWSCNQANAVFSGLKLTAVHSG